jgi:hypothetical protein
MDATGDFGTGLRAHLGLEQATEELAPTVPATAAEPEPAPAPRHDAELEALRAFEAQLQERERSLIAREASLAARAGALLAEARALHDAVVGPPPVLPDELARRRSLRAG